MRSPQLFADRGRGGRRPPVPPGLARAAGHGQGGFVTMSILLLAMLALVLLESALIASRHLLDANHRLAAEVQARATSLAAPP